jgi:hypothetical protein
MLILLLVQQLLRSYKMYTYKLLNPILPKTVSTTVLRSDNAWIPMDEDNTDYQAYLKWVSEGNVAQPADEV